jgi:hypothetical protein
MIPHFSQSFESLYLSAMIHLTAGLSAMIHLMAGCQHKPPANYFFINTLTVKIACAIETNKIIPKSSSEPGSVNSG